MLSQKATNFTIALCNKIGGREFVIYSWDEVATCVEEGTPIDEVKELFEEARINSCITKKYMDDDQVCFAMTDKAILLKQDLESIKVLQKNKDASPMIKTDEEGNSVVVLPKTDDVLKTLQNNNSKSKAKMFVIGFLGGIFGGGFIYAIIEIIRNLI